jgi:hypothetical protein
MVLARRGRFRPDRLRRVIKTRPDGLFCPVHGDSRKGGLSQCGSRGCRVELHGVFVSRREWVNPASREAP